ncbi:MAG: calcium/sodium antiporter [Clostridia bacterium]|nr:calcium/sodium antiporter [Clostridia bacterium]
MPPIVWAILLLIVGFVMLVKGADWFVDGAAGLAEKIRIPQLVIGLTVVAFGTSAPELAVSLSSAGTSEGIALGNVVGSNITNILLILGLSAIFTALPVGSALRKVDFPVLLAVSALFILFIVTNNCLERWEGILMTALLVAYTVFLVMNALSKKKKGLIETTAEAEEDEEPKKGFAAWYAKMMEKTWFLAVALFVGLALVVCGGTLAADNAEIIAKELGVNSKIIGLTVVAIGTSLPELVTSVTAAKKGQTDIAVGNIVGSNIFNILMVAGFSAAIVPMSGSNVFLTDGLIALGAAGLLAVLGYIKGNKITRTGGIILLAGFVAYYVYLFASAFA